MSHPHPSPNTSFGIVIIILSRDMCTVFCCLTYHLWNPLDWESFRKKVWVKTYPDVSSPKNIGPSRPGHTSQLKLEKKFKAQV